MTADDPDTGLREPVGPAPPLGEGRPPDSGPAEPQPRSVPTRRAERERDRRRRRRWRAAGIVAVVLLPVLLAGGWFLWELHPPGAAGTPVTIVIQPGWGVRQAGDELQRRGVVGSSLAFQMWSRVAGGSFRAGRYRMRTHLGVQEAADALARGPAAIDSHFTLLLPPGLRLEAIAARVGKLRGHDAGAFLLLARNGSIRSRYQGAQTSTEGFTAPDTYFVTPHETDEQILTTIVEAFDRRATAAGLATGAATLGVTPQQVVTIASLVQAEAGTPADAPKVAAVILNRLHRGMPLQIDATLCYVKGGCPPVPTDADKAVASPYNTYKVAGLPPTPIMTVSDAALRATLQPASVPYLYYVTGKDGVTYYASTLAEHEQNIREHGVRGE